ncbi:MAG: hypothetical protein CR984_06800 [Proteobacteria bacterium]|nr:MAG: hypothetical protein CR984_06800 [Pseudomonadota bacterium]PIE64282.1 MAG: hypothetical protein CSA26_09020 [Desulfobacterales bacterium]
MFGLAAVHQANGFAMAGAGACIVLTGLAVLSFLISMIPRVIGLFETASAKQTVPLEPAEKEKKPIVPETLPEDVEASCSIYISCTADLGSDFSLVDLHCKAKEIGLPHPHLSINRFRDAGRLVPTEKGRFAWKPATDKPNED